MHGDESDHGGDEGPDLVVLDTSGHHPLFERPDELVTYMVDTVLATTDAN